MNIEEEWENFCNNQDTVIKDENKVNYTLHDTEAPKCGDIYISTKTKIIYLTKEIELKESFWKIPITDYMLPTEGILKKQIKYNFINEEEISYVEEKLKKENITDITVLSKSKGLNKFKDVRKISIGLCKKDIISHRTKKKSAFYNCFVLILRININGIFKEGHVKIFNTGKIEIPGIQTDEFMHKILEALLYTLNTYCGLNIDINMKTCETVLINSNFNCGYFVNREKLFDKLKYKYKIHTSYDPCSYPGIMSKFWYNEGDEIQLGIKSSKNSTQISFMIFRTGSVLIVGKCDEHILMTIYRFLINIFETEYKEIFQKSDITIENKTKTKRKKYIKISKEIEL